MIVSNERENALRTEKVLRRIAEGDAIVEEQVMRRGEIYHADLNPVFGSEQGGYRPVLIIQNNRGLFPGLDYSRKFANCVYLSAFVRKFLE